MRRWIVFFICLLALDALTKVGAIHYLPPLSGGSYPFGGAPIFSLGGVTCSLNFTVNTGAAWGLFADYPALLLGLRVFIVGFLVFFMPKTWPIWFILTGALGNIVDYFLYGHVIDFIHFTFWGSSFPIFNLADSLITLGVCGLLLDAKKKEQTQTP